MSYCPGPERGVFCILNVDHICKSALVLFSLIRACNYQYTKGPLKFEFIKFKRIHIELLLIAVIHSILLQLVIKTFLIYIITRYTWIGTFADIDH